MAHWLGVWQLSTWSKAGRDQGQIHIWGHVLRWACPLYNLISMLRHSLHYLELAASRDDEPLPPLQVQERAFLFAPHHFSDWSLHQLIPSSWPHPLRHHIRIWGCSIFSLFWAQCKSALRLGCLWPPKGMNAIFRSVFLAFVFISWKGFWHIYTKQPQRMSRLYFKMQNHSSNRHVKENNKKKHTLGCHYSFSWQ